MNKNTSIDITHFKEKLEAEKKLVEGELRSVGRVEASEPVVVAPTAAPDSELVLEVRHGRRAPRTPAGKDLGPRGRPPKIGILRRR